MMLIRWAGRINEAHKSMQQVCSAESKADNYSIRTIYPARILKEILYRNQNRTSISFTFNNLFICTFLIKKGLVKALKLKSSKLLHTLRIH